MLFKLSEKIRTYVLMLVSVFDSGRRHAIRAAQDSLKLFVSLSTR
jgi:hypothetical protein